MVVISNNFVTSSGGGGSSGGGIYASGSGVLIDRCQIIDNHSSSGSGAGGGGAYLQSGATIRNSLFLRNRSGNVGGGLYLRAAKAYNCTLINNKITFNPTGSSPAIYTTGTCVVENCITWNNIKHDIVSDPVDPGFVDGPNGNYHLTPASPFIDVVSTMDLTEQSDLEGNARVKGDGVDCGCYELDQLTPSVGIYYDCNSYVGPTNFTFKAKAFPIDATISDLYWTLDGTEPSAENNAFSGNNVVRELSPGIYSVRCKGTLNGSPFDITRENWITVKGLEIYVRETNPNAREPHDTLDTATTDLLKAVSMASSNSVIYVDEGTYTLPRHISMDNAITLISLKGPEKTLIYCTVSTTHRVSMIEMTHKMACLSGFTIDGINPESQTRPQRYGGISIRKSGAIVTNCIIRNHITENNSKNGSGISMTDGLLIDSVISNNITKSSASSELNGAVHISGGACAERCLIIDNQAASSSTCAGGGVYLYNGKLRNSLIINNSATSYGGGVKAVGANSTIEHCTIANNSAKKDYGGLYLAPEKNKTALPVVTDTILFNNFINGVAVDTLDPGFVDAANGDYHLSAASSAIDAGGATQEGELDLDGQPRTIGTSSDLGCYEYDSSHFSLGISYKKESDFGPVDVTFNAIVMPEGTVLDEEASFWTIDGTEPTPENYAFKGTNPTVELGPGIYSVRFKTTYQGTSMEEGYDNWFTLYGKKTYLVEGNPNAQEPYSSIETAGTNFFEVLDYSIAGSTMIVGDGTFTIDKYKTINHGVKIKSENGPGKTSFTYGSSCGLIIDHPDIVFEGITFKNSANRDYSYPHAFRLSRGMVTNCVISKFTQSLGNSDRAVLSIVNGTMVDTTISNLVAAGGSLNNTYVFGLQLEGANALVDRCRITAFDCKTYLSRVGAVNVSAGTLRSSIIYGNRVGGQAVRVSGNGKVENCTVVDNVAAKDGETAGIFVVSSSTGHVINSISYNNTNEVSGETADIGGLTSILSNNADSTGVGTNGIAITKRPFKRHTTVPFELLARSPLRNVGISQEWMEGAKDAFSRPRIEGHEGKVDLGAVECHAPYGTIFNLK